MLIKILKSKKNLLLVFIYLICVVSGCSSKPKKIVSPLFANQGSKKEPLKISELKVVSQSEVVAAVKPVNERSEVPKTPGVEIKLKEVPKAIISNEKFVELKKIEQKNIKISQPKAEGNTTEATFEYEVVSKENIRFIAFATTGKRSNAQKLVLLNKGLKNTTVPLKKGTIVQIPKSLFRPDTAYLNKNFVFKYKDEIREYFKKKYAKSKPNLHKVKKKETLQSISNQHYNTTRKWQELYIINHEKIDNPNKLIRGTKLKWYKK